MNKKDILVYQSVFKNFKKYIAIPIGKQILELLYPTTCVLCGKIEKRGLCEKCYNNYQPVKEPRCMCCGKPIEDFEKELCEDCMHNKKTFTQGRSLWIHKGLVKQSIYNFKYHGHRIYAPVYAKLLIETNWDFIERWKPDIIVPIPIHDARRRKRGYNQGEVLAEAIYEELNKKVTYRKNCISRRKETVFQKNLDNKGRQKNIEGAFCLEKKEALYGTVLVVDDIYTTGATIQEISKVLLKGGAETVVFLTISIGQGF